MNRTEHLGNVIFPDPTAEEAMGRAVRSMQTQQITDKRLKLEELNRKREAGEVTRKEFWRLRAPLVKDYRDINQANITQKGGRK